MLNESVHTGSHHDKKNSSAVGEEQAEDSPALVQAGIAHQLTAIKSCVNFVIAYACGCVCVC